MEVYLVYVQLYAMYKVQVIQEKSGLFLSLSQHFKRIKTLRLSQDFSVVRLIFIQLVVLCS